MKVFAYVVGASHNPNAVECVVPYRVNDDIIFFGPCKRGLRKELYEQYLKNTPNGEVDVSSENLYLIGVNGINETERRRKIIWAGKILKILTFERAYHICSSDKQFEEMMQLQNSPLHLEPIYDDGKTFIGYKLRSTIHEDDDWISDVIENKNDPNVEIDLKNKTIILKNSSKRKDIFLRDCCFLCENIFFARGKGIDIDENILNIFRKVQPNKSGIDIPAIFGRRKDGKVNSLRGWLTIEECAEAKKLIEIVIKKAKSIHTRESLKENISHQGKC